eukprot:Nitzschia sp. Nitz4//scaffold358_size24170//16852//18607//NITZ4_008432-RA/size24170-processed-gene-0.35-mRNA-1//-1//CDS//3329549005//7000//frame0
MSNNPADTTSKEELSDEEWRKLLKPAPSSEQVLLALQKSYAEPGQEIRFGHDLESYDDRNFRVEIGGRPYMAKVHNGVESRDFCAQSKEDVTKSVIYLQNKIMEHLQQNGITTNEPLQPFNDRGESAPTTQASVCKLPVVSSEHSPCDLVVRILSWVKGTPMANAKLLPLEALADAGRFLGRMDKKLAELKPDELLAAKRFHQWDGKNTMELRKYIPCVQDPKRRALVESVLEAFQRDLIDSKDAEQFDTSIIHGDFNDANILIDSDFRVSGVIDFGDSLETWRILDLSVSMAYAMLSVYAKPNRSIAAAAAVLRGYNSVCPLSELERKHLILLIACRLSCSVTLGAYSYQQNPGNEYLLLHAQPGWDALGLMWGNDESKREEAAKVLNRMFAIACSNQVDPEAETIPCWDLSFPDPVVGDPMKDIREVMGDDVRPSKRRRSTFR